MLVRRSSIKALGFFAVVLAISFITIAWYFLGELDNSYKRERETLDNFEWSFLKSALHLSLNQAKIEGTFIANQIGDMVWQEFDGDLEQIAYSLDNYHEPNNYIRTVITQSLEDVYFNNIVSDNTDPFVTRGTNVETDNSDNCATFGSSRPFDLEYLMHANPYLAQEAFERIATADLENMNTAAIDRPIFFQFLSHSDGEHIQDQYEIDKGVVIPPDHTDKEAQILTSYDMDGLEAYFKETLSWQKTFEAFEFITPSYIFNREDLAGRPFVENGRRTEYERLAINIVFNFKNVINHNPILKRNLEGFSWRREEIEQKRLRYERLIYYSIIFLSIICTISMLYTNKIADISEKEDGNGREDASRDT